MTEQPNTDTQRTLGETDEWERAYVKTRRNMGQRRRRLDFFDWPGPDGRIVDLGAGDGLDRKALAERGYKKVTCVDISPRLLGSVEGSRLVADAHVLPFPTGSVDAILANSVLHHFDPPVALAEIARVLRSGGRLCFMEPRPCLPRKVLDWVTLHSGLSRIVPYFRARKVGLIEEMDVMYRWLAVYPSVPDWLAQSGLVREKEKRTLFGVLSEWRKR